MIWKDYKTEYFAKLILCCASSIVEPETLGAEPLIKHLLGELELSPPPPPLPLHLFFVHFEWLMVNVISFVVYWQC